MKKLAWFCFAIFAFGCGTPETPAPAAAPPPKVTALEDVTTGFPDFPGQEEFNANCRTCHSLRYITMQPDFPRGTWEKTVDKMIHTFGAPVPDSTRNKIVDFLMSVKGKNN